MSAMASKENPPVSPERDAPRTQLTDLLRERRSQLGEGVGKVAARSIDPVTGQEMKRGRLWRLEGNEEGGITPTDFWELRALAAGYRLPVERLQDAAGRQFHGVEPLRGTGEATAYVQKLDRLPADQRDRLLRLIDSLVPPEEG